MAGSTPIYGFPYPEATDLVADYPALGQDLAEDIEAVLPTLGGMTAIAPTTITNSGGSASTTASTTTFTGVSSISLNGVFSANFDNYRILCDYTTGTGGGIVTNFRFRTAGTDNTSAVYQLRGVADNSGVTSISVSDQNIAAMTTARDGGNALVLDVVSPFAARYTHCPFTANSATVAVIAIARSGIMSHLSTTSFDGFSIITASSTISGRVTVYGYSK
jgi:hypothetical protein